jgi:hypothetical protein
MDSLNRNWTGSCSPPLSLQAAQDQARFHECIDQEMGCNARQQYAITGEIDDREQSAPDAGGAEGSGTEAATQQTPMRWTQPKARAEPAICTRAGIPRD